MRCRDHSRLSGPEGQVYEDFGMGRVVQRHNIDRILAVTIPEIEATIFEILRQADRGKNARVAVNLQRLKKVINIGCLHWDASVMYHGNDCRRRGIIRFIKSSDSSRSLV